ncbi:MAG: biopolymer transporter ExbD [Chitinivibrionales bacterium]|nr:biopolymer transporter ExbD [Chitinivibrionales bacterium]MBD3357471.1 biopolymer transporter ExbD [Chitinivibrionales bacterium]
MAQRGRSGKKKKREGLMITSMMDMFTIILVFLLKSYSADGSILTNADNLVLPNSMSKKKPKEVNLQVAVTHDMILVDNQPVAPTEDAERIPPEEPNPVITKLEEKLESCYAQEQEMVKMGALNQVSGKVVIQLDKNISFDVLFKVMNTCGVVGYNNMNFAVMEREG